ncbi:hypothetical protein KUTeg_019853 [Tegillarca granosa]|uniref:Uncharacterized protein n=1 Tax=Tegillarca granosa TaxID=220873 RepID=A0ABQ9EDR3_TEGGR|nr:hypothetical protein KUTeg_019853 [Tegillarca granosa]
MISHTGIIKEVLECFMMVKDICKSLWCYRGKKRCETKFLPAAEGTSCGHGMWCRQGECVKFGDDGPVPIQGGWSDWTQWSDCSRTCGGGIRIRERQCNRPLPQYGGLHCTGNDKVYKMCNVQLESHPIGCDWIVGSNATNDNCGVCNGDNTSCKLIQGEYSQQPQLNTYFPVAIIPKSARSIKIAEKAISSNYIAVRDIFGKYTLNGNHKVAWPGEYTLGGAKFRYNRPYNVPETLESEGPLQEDIVVEVLKGICVWHIF